MTDEPQKPETSPNVDPEATAASEAEAATADNVQQETKPAAAENPDTAQPVEAVDAVANTAAVAGPEGSKEAATEVASEQPATTASEESPKVADTTPKVASEESPKVAEQSPKATSEGAPAATTEAATVPKPKPAPKAAAADGTAKPAPPKKAPPPPDPRVEAAKAKAEELKTRIVEHVSADAVVETGAAHTLPMLVIRKEDWVAVVDALKHHPDYQLNYLECMAGTDYKDYIEIVIYLQSVALGHFVCLKTRTDKESAEVPSLVAVHPGVNWEEREVYDLLGVTFKNHPDLRRIMLWDEFKGHPLRKDYSEWDS